MAILVKMPLENVLACPTSLVTNVTNVLLDFSVFLIAKVNRIKQDLTRSNLITLLQRACAMKMAPGTSLVLMILEYAPVRPTFWGTSVNIVHLNSMVFQIVRVSIWHFE